MTTMRAGFKVRGLTGKSAVLAGLLMVSLASVVWTAAQSAPSSTENAGSSEKQQLPTHETDPDKVLATDTARLLVLANELKAELDKSSKDTLSITVVKKAEEVEKLAHRVREEMKKSIGNP